MIGQLYEHFSLGMGTGFIGGDQILFGERDIHISKESILSNRQPPLNFAYFNLTISNRKYTIQYEMNGGFYLFSISTGDWSLCFYPYCLFLPYKYSKLEIEQGISDGTQYELLNPSDKTKEDIIVLAMSVL